MQTLKKIVCGAGFVLVLLGACCVDSPSLLIPFAMIAIGAAFLLVYVGLKRGWTEK